MGKVEALKLTLQALPSTAPDVSAVVILLTRKVEVMRKELGEHSAFLKLCLEQHTQAFSAVESIDCTFRVQDV